MVHRHKFQIKGTQLFPATLGDSKSQRSNSVFLQFCFHQSQGEGGANQGNIVSKSEQIGNSSNVIFMPVGEHDRHNVIQAITDRLKIGQDQIDTGLGFLREQDATVNDEQFFV